MSDYIIIANALLKAWCNRAGDSDASYLAGVRESAVAIADEFARNNPAFDRARFFKACGFAEVAS